jgi:N-methylhydantoinase A
MGALMGRYLSKSAEFDDVVICDIGGTSVDTGVLKGQTISTTTESVTGDQKNALETMDIPSIGSGGGSIAWIDDTGVLRVGPTSAGADPGPACYGKGGTQPTLSDANVVLGYIPTDYFLGGAVALDPSLAKQAIDRVIGKPLGMDTVEAAHSISVLAEATIAERIFMTVVEKGYDPRDFVLIAAGGAGPVHAIALGSRLKMERVYIPRHAAVFSAFGGATADFGHVLSRFYFKRDDLADPEEVSGLFHSLEKEALEVLERQGVARKDMALVRGGEMRYFGQLRDIDVALPETPPTVQATAETFGDLVRGFHDKHEELYGWGDPKLPSVLAMLKVKAIGRRRAFATVDHPFTKTDASHAMKRQRQVYFEQLGGYVETTCYDGENLNHGNIVVGPAIIEEKRTTIVVPPGWSVAVDRHDNYLATQQ